MKYRRVYALLVANGHTGYKAIEVVRDAKRGDVYALSWIRLLRQHGRR